ncbi:MAG: patatin-like phospholipase family protein [Xanthobacteraceae bacterium]
MVQKKQRPAGRLLNKVKAVAAKCASMLRFWRNNPKVRLGYFNEVLSVEHAAINKRRQIRRDDRQHEAHARAPLQKLEGGEETDGDHPLPKSCPLPTPTDTPAMNVDPANLDISLMRARPIPCTAVGIALSGGGIRSAAFSLGALQALDFRHVVLHSDYLSTVSGGGYIGACVTAGMSENGGKFPFGTSDVRDNDAIGHLRNYSNYLLPRAHSNARNMLEAAAVLLRGLIANGILVFTFLLAAALITKAAFPTWESLSSGNFLPKLFVVLLNLPRYVAALLPAVVANWINAAYATIGGWIGGFAASTGSGTIFQKIYDYVPAGPFFATSALALAVAVTLVGWAIARSAKFDVANDVDSNYLVVARSLLGIALASAFLDLQPLAIHRIFTYYDSIKFQSVFGPSLLGALASAATAIALFAQRLGAFLETTRLSTKTSVQTLRVLTRIMLVTAGLVLPMVLIAAYWYLTACLYDEVKVPQFVTPATAKWLDERMLVAFGVIVFLFEANAYSLHQFYKDRLSKAFLFKPADTLPSEPEALLNFKLSNISAENSPYHILNAALNVQGSKEANRRGRNADFFTFTRDFVGSDLTHFATTAKNEHTLGMEDIDPRLDLGSAVAISGAAISANMGSDTVRWLSPTLALLNIRLGYWLRNPRDLGSSRSVLKLREILYRIYGKFYLLLEMFNVLDEERAFVYLSDGGHIENLGIYQLLKRGCRLIIAIDAEADPNIACASLLKLERYARIDLGVRIILPWEEIRDCYRETSEAIDPRTPEEARRRHGPHSAIGRILYEDGSYGILLYLKSSLSGDEKDYVLDYKKRNSDFPHENTSDQFFTEEQFEVYRALGYHVVEGYFSGSDQVSFLKDGHRAWPNIQAAKTEVSEALGWS